VEYSTLRADSEQQSTIHNPQSTIVHGDASRERMGRGCGRAARAPLGGGAARRIAGHAAALGRIGESTSPSCPDAGDVWRGASVMRGV
jgi:hypothetical protein